MLILLKVFTIILKFLLVLLLVNLDVLLGKMFANQFILFKEDFLDKDYFSAFTEFCLILCLIVVLCLVNLEIVRVLLL